MTEPRDLLLDTEPKDLLLVVEQLRRSNRRWKSLALVACALLLFVALFSVLKADAERMRAEAMLSRALADERQARVDFRKASNPPQHHGHPAVPPNR